MAPLFLLIIFISFNNAGCSIPKQDDPMISKVFRNKRFSEVNTVKNIPLENHSNDYEDSLSEDTYITNSEENDPEGPLDHEIPYSEHEHPKEVSTHPNYTAPGKWAKPPPEKNISLEFIPTKLYAQVRASHTIKRVPQEEALETAETKDDKENAARLREVVTNSKVATVYTEEGYEDSAYDHGGHARDAGFHEGYAKMLHNELGRGTQGKSTQKDKNKVRLTKPKSKHIDDYSDDYKEHLDDSTTIVELESRKEGKLAELKEKSKLNKNTEKNFKDELNNSEFIPMFVIEEGIDKLESDIKYSNAEAEKESEIYGAEKLTKLGGDYDYDKGNLLKHQAFANTTNLRESQNSNSTDGGNGKTNKNLQLEKVTTPVYTVRPRKKPDTRTRNSQINFTASKKSKEPTTKINFVFKSNQNFPRVTEKYEETFYVNPNSSTINPTDDHGIFTLGYTLGTEMPTTINYGEMFWNYFKERQNQRALEPKIFKEKTTIHPDMITMESINGHGPYLVVNKNRNSVFTASPLGNLIPPELINNLANNPTAESGNIQWPIQTVQKTGNSANFDGIVSNTFYPDIKNLTHKSLTLSNTGYESVEDLNTFTPSRQKEDIKHSSTPTYSILPLVSNDILSPQKRTHYDHNPFLVHYARSAKANIPRYTVLIRTQAGHSKKDDSTSEQSLNTSIEQAKLEELSDNKQQIDIQSKHEKMLNHLRNQRKHRPIKNNVNIRSTQDFIFLKPPLPPPPFRGVTYPDFLPPSYASAMEHSTMTKKSRKLSGRGQRLSTNPLENDVGVNSAEFQKNLYFATPKRLPVTPHPAAHRKGLLHILYLHPPAPFNKSEYAEYRIRSKRSGELTVRATKKVKITPSQNSVPAKSIYVMRNNFQDSKKRSISIKRRTKRNITHDKKSEINIVEPEVKLLNESPRIVGEVINDEIRKRFENTGKHVNNKNEKPVNNENENIEIEIPEFEYIDKFNNIILNSSITPRVIVDIEKYPFYGNDAIPRSLTLKYIVNPERVPKKTLGGMEFYESRNYLGCEEVNPNLENVVPMEEEPVANRGLKQDLPKLQGLGEKLDCFKAKYFDDNPLDNPLFLESQVEQPMLPAELNTTKFASRILDLPSNRDDYISLQVSMNPEPVRFKKKISRLDKLRSQNNREPTELGKISRIQKIDKIKNNPFNIVRRVSVQIKNRPYRMQYRGHYKIPEYSTTYNKRVNEEDLYATTPYQAEVYEDVMGTIQNLEHMYDTVRNKPPSTTFKTTLLSITTPPTAIPAIKIPRRPSKSSGQKFMRYVTDSLRQKETGMSLMDITDKPFHLYPPEIEGLVPPLEGTRILRTIPHRNKIAYRKKITNDPRISSDGKPVLGYYQIIQLKKRSIRSILFPMTFTKKKSKRSITDSSLKSISSKSSNISNRTSNITVPIIQIPLQRKRKFNTLMSASSKTEENMPFNNTKKIVYTIMDRIRHSKPKDDYGRHGRFTIEPMSLEIDSRRQEPRYSPVIKRRKISVNTLLPTSLPISTSTTELNTSKIVLPTSSSNITIILMENQASKRKQTVNEQKEVATFNSEVPSKRKKSVYAGSTEKLKEDEDKSDNNSQYNHETEKTPENQYNVYEDVSEEKPHAELIEYLRLDPPGYDKAFSKGSNTNQDQDNHSSKVDDRKEREDDTGEKDNYEHNDSSENFKEYSEDSDSESQDEKSIADQSSSVKSKDINEDDRTFERFNSRPFSPSENFEDDKYADLGPRIHKPAFYHPPFIVPEYERSHLGRIINRSDSDESAESGDIKQYVFPWEEYENVSKEEEEDVDNGEETRHFSRVIKNYEFPWEKRNRLAKEKRNKKRFKLSTQDKYTIDSDVNSATSDKKESYVYPWDHYDVPSQDYTMSSKSNSWRFDSTFNNDEGTTECQPVTKFSSRYRHQPSNDINFLASVTERVQRSFSTPLAKLLNVDQVKLSTTPKTTSTVSNRKTSSLNIIPELLKKAPKQKRKEKNAWINSNKTITNFNPESIKKPKLSQIMMNMSLHGLKRNVHNPSQVKSVTVKPAIPFTRIIDPVSKIIRKWNNTKSNSKISKNRRSDSKQINTTKLQNRRRGRPSTTISPEVIVLTKTIASNRRSPFSRFIVGDKNLKRNLSSDSMASTRSILSTEDDFDFHIPTPASRTIEHRSTVSKEEIITKTVYPSEDTFFDKNKSVSDKQGDIFDSKEIKAPIKRVKINRRKKLKGVSTKNHATEKEENLFTTMTEAPNHIYHAEEIDNNGIRKMYIRIIAHNNTTPPSNEVQFLIKKPATEEINRKINGKGFNFDVHTGSDKQDTEVGTTLNSDIHVTGNLMENIPLQTNDEEKESEERKKPYILSDAANLQGGEDQQVAEKNRRELHLEFIRDPSKRLYYYADHHEES